MADAAWHDGTNFSYGLIAHILIGLALAIGFIRRLVLARKVGHPRSALAPFGDAGAINENLVLGRLEVAPTELFQEVEHSLPLDPKD